VRTSALAIVLCLVTGPVAAETIYRYLDDKGGVTYTNIPSAVPKKGVEKIDIPTPPRSGGPSSPTAKLRPNAPSPSDFPKVDTKTQRKRDESRKQILADELNSEDKLLADARKALAEGESSRQGDEKNYQKYLDRVQKLKDTVTLHEKNVDALKKELSALK
jgi:hypothetical protein